jgi:hypothetical protein
MPIHQQADAPAQEAPLQRGAANDLANLLARAAALVAPILRARGQTVVMGPVAADIAVDRKPCRLVALMAAAFQEISGYTTRNGAITCTTLRHAIVLRGENPIIMPDAALTADWLMLGRARALGIDAILSWDQGRGPVLTLAMPLRASTGGVGAMTGWFAPA